MPSELVKTLEGIVGAEHVLADGEARRYAVDGVIPAVAVFPGSVEEVSEILRACSKSKAAVVPWGAGCYMGVGGVPERVEIVLGLAVSSGSSSTSPGT